jgi:hypothetical protein
MTNPPTFSVVAVGGYNEQMLNSVEILDEGADHWRFGPGLPKTVSCAALVEDPLGGVILIGGFESGWSRSQKMYRLGHAGIGARWLELPQKMSLGRVLHVAAMVPESVANCSLSEN